MLIDGFKAVCTWPGVNVSFLTAWRVLNSLSKTPSSITFPLEEYREKNFFLSHEPIISQTDCASEMIFQVRFSFEKKKQARQNAPGISFQDVTQASAISPRSFRCIVYVSTPHYLRYAAEPGRILAVSGVSFMRVRNLTFYLSIKLKNSKYTKKKKSNSSSPKKEERN